MQRLRLTAVPLGEGERNKQSMHDDEPKPVYCPQCREFVAPLLAAVKWCCPHCVWQFSQADIDHCEQWDRGDQSQHPSPSG